METDDAHNHAPLDFTSVFFSQMVQMFDCLEAVSKQGKQLHSISQKWPKRSDYETMSFWEIFVEMFVYPKTPLATIVVLFLLIIFVDCKRLTY